MAKEIIFGIGCSEIPVIAMTPANLLFKDQSLADLPVHRFLGSKEEIIKNVIQLINDFYTANDKIDNATVRL